MDEDFSDDNSTPLVHYEYTVESIEIESNVIIEDSEFSSEFTENFNNINEEEKCQESRLKNNYFKEEINENDVPGKENVQLCSNDEQSSTDYSEPCPEFDNSPSKITELSEKSYQSSDNIIPRIENVYTCSDFVDPNCEFNNSETNVSTHEIDKSNENYYPDTSGTNYDEDISVSNVKIEPYYCEYDSGPRISEVTSLNSNEIFESSGIDASSDILGIKKERNVVSYSTQTVPESSGMCKQSSQHEASVPHMVTPTSASTSPCTSLVKQVRRKPGPRSKSKTVAQDSLPRGSSEKAYSSQDKINIKPCSIRLDSTEVSQYLAKHQKLQPFKVQKKLSIADVVKLGRRGSAHSDVSENKGNPSQEIPAPYQAPSANSVPQKFISEKLKLHWAKMRQKRKRKRGRKKRVSITEVTKNSSSSDKSSEEVVNDPSQFVPLNSSCTTPKTLKVMYPKNHPKSQLYNRDCKYIDQNISLQLSPNTKDLESSKSIPIQSNPKKCIDLSLLKVGDFPIMPRDEEIPHQNSKLLACLYCSKEFYGVEKLLAHVVKAKHEKETTSTDKIIQNRLSKREKLNESNVVTSCTIVNTKSIELNTQVMESNNAPEINAEVASQISEHVDTFMRKVMDDAIVKLKSKKQRPLRRIVKKQISLTSSTDSASENSQNIEEFKSNSKETSQIRTELYHDKEKELKSIQPNPSNLDDSNLEKNKANQHGTNLAPSSPISQELKCHCSICGKDYNAKVVDIEKFKMSIYFSKCLTCIFKERDRNTVEFAQTQDKPAIKLNLPSQENVSGSIQDNNQSQLSTHVPIVAQGTKSGPIPSTSASIIPKIVGINKPSCSNESFINETNKVSPNITTGTSEYRNIIDTSTGKVLNRREPLDIKYVPVQMKGPKGTVHIFVLYIKCQCCKCERKYNIIVNIHPKFISEFKKSIESQICQQCLKNKRNVIAKKSTTISSSHQNTTEFTFCDLDKITEENLELESLSSKTTDKFEIMNDTFEKSNLESVSCNLYETTQDTLELDTTKSSSEFINKPELIQKSHENSKPDFTFCDLEELAQENLELEEKHLDNYVKNDNKVLNDTRVKVKKVRKIFNQENEVENIANLSETTGTFTICNLEEITSKNLQADFTSPRNVHANEDESRATEYIVPDDPILIDDELNIKIVNVTSMSSDSGTSQHAAMVDNVTKDIDMQIDNVAPESIINRENNLEIYSENLEINTNKTPFEEVILENSQMYKKYEEINETDTQNEEMCIKISNVTSLAKENSESIKISQINTKCSKTSQKLNVTKTKILNSPENNSKSVNNTFNCQKCNRTIPIYRHINGKLLKQSVLCSNCLRSCSISVSKDDLHPMYTCLHCPARAMTAHVMALHTKIKHNVSMKILYCKICNQSCSDAADLRKHVQVIHVYRHACLHCDLRFLTALQLSDHVKSMHSTELNQELSSGTPVVVNRNHNQYADHLQSHQASQNIENNKSTFIELDSTQLTLQNSNQHEVCVIPNVQSVEKQTPLLSQVALDLSTNCKRSIIDVEKELPQTETENEVNEIQASSNSSTQQKESTCKINQTSKDPQVIELVSIHNSKQSITVKEVNIEKTTLKIDEIELGTHQNLNESPECLEKSTSKEECVINSSQKQDTNQTDISLHSNEKSPEKSSTTALNSNFIPQNSTNESECSICSKVQTYDKILNKDHKIQCCHVNSKNSNVEVEKTEINKLSNFEASAQESVGQNEIEKHVELLVDNDCDVNPESDTIGFLHTSNLEPNKSEKPQNIHETEMNMEAILETLEQVSKLDSEFSKSNCNTSNVETCADLEDISTQNLPEIVEITTIKENKAENNLNSLHETLDEVSKSKSNSTASEIEVIPENCNLEDISTQNLHEIVEVTTQNENNGKNNSNSLDILEQQNNISNLTLSEKNNMNNKNTNSLDVSKTGAISQNTSSPTKRKYKKRNIINQHIKLRTTQRCQKPKVDVDFVYDDLFENSVNLSIDPVPNVFEEKKETFEDHFLKFLSKKGASVQNVYEATQSKTNSQNVESEKTKVNTDKKVKRIDKKFKKVNKIAGKKVKKVQKSTETVDEMVVKKIHKMNLVQLPGQSGTIIGTFDGKATKKHCNRKTVVNKQKSNFKTRNLRKYSTKIEDILQKIKFKKRLREYTSNVLENKTSDFVTEFQPVEITTNLVENENLKINLTEKQQESDTECKKSLNENDLQSEIKLKFFTCHHCQNIFTDSNVFRDHLSIHITNLLKKSKKLSSKLKKKTVEKSPEKSSRTSSRTRTQCENCEIYFTTFLSLENHICDFVKSTRENIKVMKNIPKFRCHSCLSLFKSKRELEKHIKIYHITPKKSMNKKVVKVTPKKSQLQSDKIENYSQDNVVSNLTDINPNIDNIDEILQYLDTSEPSSAVNLDSNCITPEKTSNLGNLEAESVSETQEIKQKRKRRTRVEMIEVRKQLKLQAKLKKAKKQGMAETKGMKQKRKRRSRIEMMVIRNKLLVKENLNEVTEEVESQERKQKRKRRTRLEMIEFRKQLKLEAKWKKAKKQGKAETQDMKQKRKRRTRLEMMAMRNNLQVKENIIEDTNQSELSSTDSNVQLENIKMKKKRRTKIEMLAERNKSIINTKKELKRKQKMCPVDTSSQSDLTSDLSNGQNETKATTSSNSNPPELEKDMNIESDLNSTSDVTSNCHDTPELQNEKKKRKTQTKQEILAKKLKIDMNISLSQQSDISVDNSEENSSSSMLSIAPQIVPHNLSEGPVHITRQKSGILGKKLKHNDVILENNIEIKCENKINENINKILDLNNQKVKKTIKKKFKKCNVDTATTKLAILNTSAEQLDCTQDEITPKLVEHNKVSKFTRRKFKNESQDDVNQNEDATVTKSAKSSTVNPENDCKLQKVENVLQEDINKEIEAANLSDTLNLPSETIKTASTYSTRKQSKDKLESGELQANPSLHNQYGAHYNTRKKSVNFFSNDNNVGVNKILKTGKKQKLSDIESTTQNLKAKLDVNTKINTPKRKYLTKRKLELQSDLQTDEQNLVTADNNSETTITRKSKEEKKANKKMQVTSTPSQNEGINLQLTKKVSKKEYKNKLMYTRIKKSKFNQPSCNLKNKMIDKKKVKTCETNIINVTIPEVQEFIKIRAANVKKSESQVTEIIPQAVKTKSKNKIHCKVDKVTKKESISLTSEQKETLTTQKMSKDKKYEANNKDEASITTPESLNVNPEISDTSLCNESKEKCVVM